MATQETQRLQTFIADHSGDLLRILRHYVLRMDIATYDVAQSVAADLLNDVVVEALKQPDKLPESVEPLPWLLGIAVNLIKRRRAEHARRSQREPLILDLYPTQSMGEDEIIDQFFAAAEAAPDANIHSQEWIAAILANASPEDAHIIKLAVLHDFSGEELGEHLNISPGAARVRLHRALKRQRQLLGDLKP